MKCQICKETIDRDPRSTSFVYTGEGVGGLIHASCRDEKLYQPIRQILLDLTTVLNHDGGLDNVEIAKVHFDLATDKILQVAAL